MQLMPNPTKDMVTVVYNLQPNEEASLSLYNLTGQSVLQKELTGNGKIDLNLQQLLSGIYTYKAVGNMGSLYSGKLVITK